ncbi:MAG TPA: type I restriction-modification enzyme R subunit C-terminal domain-containing protein [Herpetosiphonaceae bacterium]|nr:type I restriction-modification enzyme R subunit C-terminal domain-containing protein [Herpetosiphonaceae bacterium]
MIASAPGFQRRQAMVATEAEHVTTYDFALSTFGEGSGKIEAHGINVSIADEALFVVEGLGEPLTLERYLDYSREKISGYVPDWNKLQAIWQEPHQRQVLLAQLAHASVHLDVLSDVLRLAQADQFDLLAHIAYGRPIRSRAERAAAFRSREQLWIDQQTQQAREVVLALLEKYELGGLREMTDPAVFRVSPFREMGEVRGVLSRFGGDARLLRITIDELQRRLYAA